MVHPWTERFVLGLTDSQIGELVRIRPKSVSLQKNSVDQDCEALRIAMSQQYRASVRDIAAIRKLLNAAMSYSHLHYENPGKILKIINEPSSRTIDPPPAFCLTGLAGIGKSALLLAFRRLIDRVTLADLPGVQGIQLRPAWFLSLKEGTGMSSLLSPYATPAVNSFSSSKTNGLEYKSINTPRGAALLNLCRRISWRDGICLVILDELQFVTQGDTNAKVTRILLDLMELGPQLVFCCNYSLGHKLKNRRQEDRHRLLSQPIILDPEVVSSKDWYEFLCGLQSVAPTIFAFNISEVQAEIHQLTFGIRRLAIKLLVESYRIASIKRPQKQVNVEDIRRAYRSTAYSIFREEVEILYKQSLTGKSIRDDLWCPFDRSEESSQVFVAKRAIEDYGRRLDELTLDQFLNKDERQIIAREDHSKIRSVAKKNVVSIRLSKSLKQQLRDGADEFE